MSARTWHGGILLGITSVLVAGSVVLACRLGIGLPRGWRGDH
jgi:hypothetical protein